MTKLHFEITVENVYGDDKAMFAFAGGFLHTLGQMMVAAAATNFTELLAEQLLANQNVSTDGETKISVKVGREK